ncbi:hypothetical protein YC2023_091014 [Brassica napus]
MSPPEAEMGAVAVTAPPKPGTPRGPLITGMRVDSVSFDHRKPIPPCKCLPMMGNPWGQHDTCFTDIPSPGVSLTRKKPQSPTFIPHPTATGPVRSKTNKRYRITIFILMKTLIFLLGAEFVGTFILIFTATAGPIVNQKYDGAETLIGNAACAGLAVMIIILSTGHISGAHLNPSMTIAFAALRHFPWAQVPAYIAAQVSASICASFALKAVFHPFMSGGVTVPSVSVGQAFALEFIISFILLFVITAVATDTRAVGELAGIAVGATVMLNNLVAGPSSGASMNPVRTLGPALASGNYRSLWVYMVAPTLGAISGAAVYTGVKLNDNVSDPPRQVQVSHCSDGVVCFRRKFTEDTHQAINPSCSMETTWKTRCLSLFCSSNPLYLGLE